MSLLFDRMFKNGGTGGTAQPAEEPVEESPIHAGFVVNLEKDQAFNLTKAAGPLKKVRAAAGWDMALRGTDYDLDLCSYLLNADKKIVDTVFYGHKHGKGIYLDGDNLTGGGDGDDENIYVSLSGLDEDVKEIIFAVVIFQGKLRRQSFKGVKNAFVRLVNAGTDAEICRYNLSSNGGDNTAVIAARLYKENDEWIFKAVEQYEKGSIRSLKHIVENL
jgi:tellurium resistance protein TerD